MINILKSIIIIPLIALFFSSCDSEPQVQVEREPFRNTNYPNVIHHKIIVTALKDNIEIKNIVVNNENKDCKVRATLPIILNSYQNLVEAFLFCKVKKVDIFTNKGDWSFQFN